MWVLPSRARPHNVERLVSAWKATGATTPVWLRVDVDDTLLEAYTVMDLPDGWLLEVGPRLPLSEIYNEFYASGPRPWYGFIADDVVPKTPGWDERLIEVAGRDGMAVPAGGHDPHGAPHFVLGADLVNSAGWLSLPGLDRLYIDTVWIDIAKEKGTLRRVPDVVLEHRHFSNRKSLMDQTYRKHRKAEDRAIYETWKRRHYDHSP